MKNYLDPQWYRYKLCCDGYDFIQNTSFEFSELEKQYALDHTLITNFPKIQSFYEHTISLQNLIPNKILPKNLIQKYDVGFYKVEMGLNFHDTYILFSDENIRKWNNIIQLVDLEFMVAWSRDKKGIINGFGMRVLNDDVLQAFKWLFPMGQSCTFGLHDIIGNTIITVEGFTDYIALRESGYNNVIGLGSAFLEPAHEKILSDYKIIQCPDQDSFGMTLRHEMDNKNIQYCYYSSNEKDPYDAYKKHGSVDLIMVN